MRSLSLAWYRSRRARIVDQFMATQPAVAIARPAATNHGQRRGLALASPIVVAAAATAFPSSSGVGRSSFGISTFDRSTLGISTFDRSIFDKSIFDRSIFGSSMSLSLTSVSDRRSLSSVGMVGASSVTVALPY